ncbi:MAG TPA: hypothetical protein VES64_04255 [Allosphingosinicella sp.]|nr:hypothetical protein [Allosphingosinicella sp.]
MILKLLIVLVLAFVLLSMTSRYLRPKVPPKAKGPAIETARKCPECGAYVVGAGPCEQPGCASRGKT